MAGRKRRVVGLLVVPLALGFLALRGSGEGTVVHAFTASTAPPIEKRLLRASEVGVAEGTRPTGVAEVAAGQSGASLLPPNYEPAADGECPVRLRDNIKVNQGCVNVGAPPYASTGHVQNDASVAGNPNHPDQLIAGFEDYTLGDCLGGGAAFSSDGGATWQDSQVPMEFTPGSDFSGDSSPRMYWQCGGNETVAWDTHDDAYIAASMYNAGSSLSDNPDASSAVYVYRSGNGGASWTFPGTAAATAYSPTTSSSGLPVIDLSKMTVDDHTASRFRDRIYATWGLSAADGTTYIYESWSSDYGRSFSAPVLVSRNSGLCPINYSNEGVTPENGDNCDESDFPDPFTGPDGALYIAFTNYNNATTTANNNVTQILIAKSSNGGLSFGAPVQVAEYNDLPDCATYQAGQDYGISCLPEKGSGRNSVFPAFNQPAGAVSNGGEIAVTVGSYINKDSDAGTGCKPDGLASDGYDLYKGVKTYGACANKILLSLSSNGGRSFNDTGRDPSADPLIPQAASQAHTDQWWQWSAFAASGTLAVSYYDRQYDRDETSGDMDITLSTSSNLSSFTNQRATSWSMPLPTQFTDGEGNGQFLGAYSGLAVSAGVAHPMWTDTRDVELFDCGTNPPSVCTLTEPNGLQADDEDVFTVKLPLSP